MSADELSEDVAEELHKLGLKLADEVLSEANSEAGRSHSGESKRLTKDDISSAWSRITKIPPPGNLQVSKIFQFGFMTLTLTAVVLLIYELTANKLNPLERAAVAVIAIGSFYGLAVAAVSPRWRSPRESRIRSAPHQSAYQAAAASQISSHFTLSRLLSDEAVNIKDPSVIAALSGNPTWENQIQPSGNTNLTVWASTLALVALASLVAAITIEAAHGLSAFVVIAFSVIAFLCVASQILLVALRARREGRDRNQRRIDMQRYAAINLLSAANRLRTRVMNDWDNFDTREAAARLGDIRNHASEVEEYAWNVELLAPELAESANSLATAASLLAENYVIHFDRAKNAITESPDFAQLDARIADMMQLARKLVSPVDNQYD